MRFVWLALLAVGTLCPAIAHANTRVANAVIDLPIAAEYCRFVPQNALDQLASGRSEPPPYSTCRDFSLRAVTNRRHRIDRHTNPP
jgi:hypothetical protein